MFNSVAARLELPTTPHRAKSSATSLIQAPAQVTGFRTHYALAHPMRLNNANGPCAKDFRAENSGLASVPLHSLYTDQDDVLDDAIRKA
jgi:hypothetical protein